MRRSLLMLGLICLPAMGTPGRDALAGAWLLPEGSGQIITTATVAESRNAYDAQGRLRPTPAWRKIETRAYVEHGLRDWLTLTAEAGGFDFHGAAQADERRSLLILEAKAGLPLVAPAQQGPQYRGAGIGALGARVKLLDAGDAVVSFEAGLRAATPASRVFLDMRQSPQFDARLLVARNYELFGMQGFTEAQIGWRSAGQTGDEARLDTTIGLRPLPRVLLLAQSFTAVAPGAQATTRLAAQKLQLSGVFEATKNLSVQLGVGFAPAGANAPQEKALISGLWFRY